MSEPLDPALSPRGEALAPAGDVLAPVDRAPAPAGETPSARSGLPPLARDVFTAIPEIAEDMGARPSNETCPGFVDRLLASPTPEEAVTFFAYLLPPEAAVLWGHRCIAAKTSATTPAERPLADLIAVFVASGLAPDEREALRQEIRAVAETSRPRSPVVWIALGLAWSTGSLSAPDLPPLTAPAYATPRAINAGVLGLLARADIAERAATLSGFVAIGRRIAAAIAAGRPA
ncbi:hypothetical protein [Aurantimonas sp. 22II-16-19i]|uniref:DUF6931 family protein n=1 Tax=Aurantimonas sp. 22II-16-19i TaxID=1317114 RepID=UPI0009F7D114|nr:hypothetical protein [Aurantimonas sp. 22II-16-19i]ORE92834.1 hypothetical protein ATO4_16615 [Aurantimonas sp. 22II-16-19i]